MSEIDHTIPPSEQHPQGRLFPDGRVVYAGPTRVVPFEMIRGGRLEPQVSRPRVEDPPRPPAAKVPGRPSRPASRVPDAQHKLEFLPPAQSGRRKLNTTVEAVIYCDAPLATLLHRAVAFALDWSLVLMAYALFLGAYSLLGGQFVLTRANLTLFGAAYLLVALFYGVVWVLANGETPGRRWVHLRLTTFEGFPLGRGQRLLRLLGTSVSVCSLGAGFLWALVDEERLTWHDHISRTFPTPLDVGSSPIVRRR